MFILGKKLKMTQIWQGDKVVPVTVLKTNPNKVTALRSKEKNGYEAVQVSFAGHKKEFRSKWPATFEIGQFKPGDEVGVAAFSEGDTVRISGISKGRGFQGVVKRHGFGGGPKTHGQKNRFRAPGSIGATAPQRIFPGRKMAGHMGAERVTLKGLRVAKVDKENNLLFLKGAVPGHIGSIVEVSKIKGAASK